MKRTALLLLMLLMLAALCACGAKPGQEAAPDGRQTEQQTERQEAEPMEITKEYLIAHSSLTEEDFEDVDFDDFAASCGLSAELLEKYAPELLLGLYKAERDAEPTVDYSPIYANAEGRIGEAELDAVEVLVWEYHEGSYNDCMVVDRATGAVYYGEGWFLDEVGESKRVSGFGEEDAAFLRETLKKSGIASWQNEYRGSSEGTTGHFGWVVALRLRDGRCFRYEGGGVKDSGTPDTLRPMMKALIARFSA